MKSSIFKLFMSLVLVTNLFCMPVQAAEKDNWNIHYITGAPSPVSVQSDGVSVTFYSGGFVAKTVSISGSNNRHIEIYGINGTVMSVIPSGASTIMVTTTGFSPDFTTSGGNPTSYFNVFGHGYQTCYSTGWICVNIQSVIDSL